MQMVLKDQSQPLPYAPAFTGTWRFLVGFCVFPILTPLVTVYAHHWPRCFSPISALPPFFIAVWPPGAKTVKMSERAR